jgi:FLVCR family feline leukemia virus subgroup C receptor-related protein
VTTAFFLCSISSDVVSGFHHTRTNVIQQSRIFPGFSKPDIHKLIQHVKIQQKKPFLLLHSHTEPTSKDVSSTTPHPFQPQVYPERWTHLIYLSLLALLSDLICFSVSAAPSTFEQIYSGHSAASVIDIFLYTNVLGCFLVADVVQRFGLGSTIKAAAALMTLGCFFRSGLSFLTPLVAMTSWSGDEKLVPYWSIVAGTVMVGLAQPFFQCTPPALSAVWFAADERATATAVALNMNQIGIGIAFLVGGKWILIRN